MRPFVVFIILMAVFPLQGSATDTLKLDEVIVSARYSPAVYSRLARIVHVLDAGVIQEMPAGNIQDILEYVSAIDVRQRGSHGVQADLSLRGGSFEQVLVLLNGVKINDPQTGHHNLNIPLDISDIERIEVLEGPGSRIYGPNAFSGAVNIVTREPGGNSFSGSLSGGQYGFWKLHASGGWETGPVSSIISFGKSSSDGFADNTDFSLFNVFYRGLIDAGIAGIDIQAGHTDKGFGANSFYSALYPEQYEEISSTFANLTVTTGEGVSFRQSVYFRGHNDRFELFRYESAPWYGGHNYHMTGIYGTVAVVTIPWSAGSFALGAELRTERIYSSVLGDILDDPRPVKNEENIFYNYSKQRDQANITGSSTVIFNQFALSAGLLASRTGEEGWGVYGGTDLSYSFGDHLDWFASYNRSLRLPSFTEMYYTGPVHRGNTGLKPEEAGTMESGFRYMLEAWHGHAAAFNRKGYSIIDWVRMENELIWESRNITRLNTYGIEFEINWKKPEGVRFPIREFRAGYAFLDISRQSEEYISAYVLDHLKHKFVSGIILPLHNRAVMTVMAIWQERSGTYTDVFSGSETEYDPFLLVDLGINIRMTQRLRLSAEASNLFNKTYTDIGNVPVPGLWIKGGLEFSFYGN